ncbi:MAG TPA: OmpH family outer membrane protein, partial [Gemmatimonadales bacterium]|nr:OmpH family outer membrane protein [Gemmatimonadales bacterium]
MTQNRARAMRVLTAAAALSLMGTAARAQQPTAPVQLRVAYVNSQAILANTPGRAQAESTFAREMTGFRAEIQRLQAELDSALQAYQRTEVALSPQARTQRQSELRQLEQRNRQRAQEIEQQASQREQELIAPILQRINAVIEGIRAEFNYHLIFDVAAQNS